MCRSTAVCDVHRGRVEAAAAMAGGNVAKYADFRKLLATRTWMRFMSPRRTTGTL